MFHPLPPTYTSFPQCRIRGSEFVEGLKLDRQFYMKMTTELTWKPAQGSSTEGSISASSKLDVYCNVVSPFQFMPRPVLEGTCNSILQVMMNGYEGRKSVVDFISALGRCMWYIKL